MKKQDLIPAILLVLMIPLWTLVISPKLAPKTTPIAAPETSQEQNLAEAPPPTAVKTETVDQPAEEATEPTPTEPAKTITLKNRNLELTTTSQGGGVASATLLNYTKLKDKDSGLVQLDFSESPALAYSGVKGISTAHNLTIQGTDSNSVHFSKTLESGRVFERSITLGDNYIVTITDRFINQSDEFWKLPPREIVSGRMENPKEMHTQRGVSLLGVDSYSTDGKINFWGRKLHSLFKKNNNPTELVTVPEEMNGVTIEWVAAKNKFFAQIIRPNTPTATMKLIAEGNQVKKSIVPKNIAVALDFKEETIDPKSSLETTYSYYIGPKDFDELQSAGNYMEGVMEFQTIGFFSGMNWLMEPARKSLLWTLNKFHALIPNYGIAIILLTILVRVLFWPLTHKSTESMKRMQEIQPLIKALQEKHKGNPQRLQQETIKLYREHKVNPMGGCLPMVIQIPVFIALFTVLRNAIELRFAGFLWAPDLSAPENLFAGSIPYIGSLNILPLLMSASMFWQQKLTPTAPAATPEQQQQQKMMMIMMPIMMLVFFYKMPSGLVVYWTTSQLLMILQMSIRNMKKSKESA